MSFSFRKQQVLPVALCYFAKASSLFSVARLSPDPWPQIQIMKRILIKLTGSLLILGISLTLFASFSSLALGSSLNTDASYMETDDIQLTEVPVNTITDQVAEEPAKYNFASAQGASSLRVVPGGEVKGVIRFYNIDGNRTTHITLEAVQAPENWEVEIVPPLHDTEVQSV